MQIIEKNVEELIPYINNPRNNECAIDAVASSIAEFGFKVPCVVDKNNVLVTGHTRLLAAKKLGLKAVPCIIADDMSDAQIKAFRLADNKVSEFATWNEDLLKAELEQLKDLDFDMSDFGFSLEDLNDLDGLEESEDDIPEINEDAEPTTKQGQIYKLGNHRLMCGDSTSIEDVRRLCDGKQMDLLITDPPYNVAYEGKTKDKLTIKNDSMDNESFLNFLVAAYKCAEDVMRSGAAFYIWHADSEGFNFRYACNLTSLKIKECLIWVKNSLVMGRQDYQWKHEPCLYGWKEGGSHNWYSDRCQTTVLEFDRPARNDIHPTMKPVNLFAYQINNSSAKGQNVLDLFGGSGTTMIACEQLGRNAFLMELDPRYCDAIIQRWEQLTGKKAELIQ